MDTLYLYFFAETESSNCGFMNIFYFIARVTEMLLKALIKVYSVDSAL